MDRMQLRLAIACFALLDLAACGDDDSPMITFPDAGPVVDAGGGGTDAGQDAGGGGTCGSVVGATGFPQLPAGCGMRCLQSTLQQAQMCPMDDDACVDAAFAADPTPSAQLDIGGGMTQEIDCEGCLSWQGTSCIAEACPSQFNAYAMCARTAANPMTACASQIQAVFMCRDMSTTIQSCQQSRLPVCIRTSATFAPSFQPAMLPTPSNAQLEAWLLEYAGSR